jgi:hypothetical protein
MTETMYLLFIIDIIYIYRRKIIIKRENTPRLAKDAREGLKKNIT